MQETYNRAFKGIWIPKDIWLAKDLGWTEKLVLVELDSLDGDQGCWASNAYLANFFGLSKDRISKIISALKEKGYITVDMQYKPGTKIIEKRIIKVRQYPIGENNDTYSRKQRDPIVENNDTPIGENAKENNTVFNNTSNNTRDIDSQSSSPFINPNFEPIKQLFESKVRIATFADCNNIHEALEFYEPKLIDEAIIAGSNNARSFKYIRSILDNWRKELGVKTYADWQVKIDAKNGRPNGSSHGGTKSEKPSIFGDYCSD